MNLRHRPIARAAEAAKRPGRRKAAAVLLALCVFGVCPLAAHDFWIEPSTFRPETGSTLAVRLRVGEEFAGEPVARDPARIERFVLAGPAGEQPVAGRHGSEPAGFARIDAPGLLVIGYRSRASSVELAAPKFEEYLAQEGLEHVSALRARRGESAKEGREIFSRCAKALVLAGPPVAAGYDRRVGFTLELIPEKNPYLMAGGGEMPIRVLHESQPLQGVLIVAMDRRKPRTKLRARSDADGRALFRLPAAGQWLVKAVHMVPAPAGTGTDWESLWASLTFEIPAASGSR